MDFATLNDSDLALWIYGSCARGDSDSQSDFDVLAICDCNLNESDVAILLGSDPSSIALSVYSWAELEGIAEYGSLFLHHVRLEGRRVLEAAHVSGRLRKILESLGPYKRVRQDMAAFRAGLEDVRESLNDGGSVVFELSVMATIMRHAAILGCYVAGSPTFGRFSAVDRLVDLQFLEKQVAYRFRELYAYRLQAARGTAAPRQMSIKYALWWLREIERLVIALEEKTYGFKANL
jgi:hypothetical protein